MSLNQAARPKAESIPLRNDSISTSTSTSTGSEGASSHSTSPPQPPRPSGLKAQTLSTWTKHRAAILMLAATFCGITMNTCARVLEHGGGGDDEDPSRRPMHPMQMLLVRMAVTVFFSTAYMRWRPSPQFPWGPREVRGLLLVRGVCGFFGIWGMWQSLIYLPLAEATVITFLAPSVTGYVCHVLIHEPFTRPEQVASLVALAGVVIIARPTSLLGWGAGGGEPVGGGSQQWAAATAGNNATGKAGMETAGGEGEGDGDGVTPAQRVGAIGIALVGVLGTAGAYTTIRKMGARVNPLVPTYYFAWVCTIVSLAALVFGPILDVAQPELRFRPPHGAWEWLFLLIICVAGFLTQFLLTAALGGVKGGSAASQAATRNRALSMSYTAMVFAAVSDKLVFDIDMDAATLVGSVLIIGSAMWAAFSKKEEAAPTAERPREDDDLESGAGGATASAGRGGEDARLLSDREGSSDEGNDPAE